MSRPLDIVAVVTDDTNQSNVLRGENGGRLLQHVAVARSLVRVATVTGDGGKSVYISFPGGFNPGRLRSSPDPVRSGETTGRD